MATVLPDALADLNSDPILLNSIIDAVRNSLTMCDAEVKCVGVSTVPARDTGNITGMIGVHGDVSGFITVNMAEAVALATVGGLLQDRFDKLSPQVIDGAGEITGGPRPLTKRDRSRFLQELDRMVQSIRRSASESHMTPDI